MLNAIFYSAVCQLYHNKTEKSKSIKRGKVKKKKKKRYKLYTKHKNVLNVGNLLFQENLQKYY